MKNQYTLNQIYLEYVFHRVTYNVFKPYITKEQWITTPVQMKIYQEIKIFSTNKEPKLQIHPFNNKALPLLTIGSANAKIKIIRTY